ncbi:hypothetical protein BDM02DRAFT_3189458 [Thelephora ganbajun]|uniref:Uncharacterized protein n=1 Tax=Thelephora ganbajun TaxID=370292 RepID=A0ACB6Z8K5_THEGA|nr:hypothetical protein BDM02DRAFT_3189458 [Thelephora ganbajun]
MEDIWDSPILRNFHDIDQGSFFHGRAGDLQLAFSLNADGFNPLHMLESKQTITCTAIYMVILNFPPHLRYLFQNMYLAGVIPGLGKPSLNQINHTLSILVAELLKFWRGILYMVTASSPFGHFVKGALIPLVCDMLAAQQLAGFSSAASTLFCTFCLTAIHDIENLNKGEWPLHNLSRHLHHAKLWKDSSSEAGRDAVFRKHGVRWSVLLDLPYWNPILFSVVDTMHSTYLGMIQSHCHRIWGVNASVKGGDGSVLQSKKLVPCPADVSAGGHKLLACRIVEWKSRVDPSQISLPPAPEAPPPPPNIIDDEPIISGVNVNKADMVSAKVLEKAEEAFSDYVIKNHKQLNVPILQAMCWRRNLETTGYKTDLFMWLSEWRKLHIPPPEEQDLDEEPRAILGKDVLESVWDDMRLTQLLSWMSPAPRNWGTAVRGKLKADQWKVIAMVHLPITLMRLWGRDAGWYFLLLCNFMDLNAAVQLANQCVITTNHDTGLQPVHHVSLHTGDFLHLFGPTHSIRTPGFEQFNKMLGSQNINMKSRELELTFTMTACWVANIEALMDGGSVLTVAQELINAFTTVSNEDHHGTCLTDEIHFPQTKPPMDI